MLVKIVPALTPSFVRISKRTIHSKLADIIDLCSR